MTHSLATFSAETALQQLHGFQRDAVEHAFERLFLAPDSTRRFLVADEVGLGKTLVARGVIAKSIEYLRSRVDRLDVVYICSNLGIARQNINRLNPLPDRDFPEAERITLLPIHLQNLRDSDLNLIAFTPGTSLDLKGSMGMRRERLLLHALLEGPWDLRGVAPLNVLQGAVGDAARFRERAREFKREFASQLDPSAPLIRDFGTALSTRPDLRLRFDALCASFSRTRTDIPADQRVERSAVVGELRSLLARTCISALEPDLIILDEFQRFKHLLSGDDESGQLARQMFEWSSDHARAHLLLLSATPFKPYVLQHEVDEENHYADFLRTVEFLHAGTAGSERLQSMMRAFRHELIRAEDGCTERLANVKRDIESCLKRVMSRTERLAATGVHNAMLRSHVLHDLDVSGADLRSYVGMLRIAQAIDGRDPLEQWKSAAYAVNFMDGYQLKENLRELADHGCDDTGVLVAIRASKQLQLPADRIDEYGELDFPNAKLRLLLSELDAARAFEVLWTPPSLPIYPLGEPFLTAWQCGLTKRLIFSSWNVVPRSIACLASYEAERRALTEDVPDLLGTVGVERDQSILLRLSMDGARPNGMPVLALMYPNWHLARVCDPRRFVVQRGRLPESWAEILAWAKQELAPELHSRFRLAGPGETGNEEWYWAAPLVLDKSDARSQTVEWWDSADLATDWALRGSDEADGSDTAQDQSRGDSWSHHVELAQRVVLNEQRPLGLAPPDLLDVVALLGLAGPGVCALRALMRLYPDPADEPHLRTAAAQIGWSFRRLLNRPQSIAVIRRNQRASPYWRLVLEYCAAGGLGQVVEEYAHVARDAAGATSLAAERGAALIADAMAESLGVRAATLTVDEIDVQGKRPVLRPHRMSCLFAMRFGSDKSEDTKQVVRDSAIRSAFNSPFWPMVLATTSVGQEGLDFHWYCHAIVHWNLPSNPVDLEQREGRVHRFKGHAIRKNVAFRWGLEAIQDDAHDIWTRMFELARADAPPGERGLMPYWHYPLEGGAWIERHISLYPLSRDELRYKALKRSLGAYRLVFGQPRQDELLAYLLDHVDEARLKNLEHLLRIDLSPPRTSR